MVGETKHEPGLINWFRRHLMSASTEVVEIRVRPRKDRRLGGGNAYDQHARLALEIGESGIVIERGNIRTAGTREDIFAHWDDLEDMLY